MEPALSLVIPAYNEERRLGPTLDRVVSYLSRRDEPWELLVVDDGSTDGTPDLVSTLARSVPQVRLLQNPGNRGKGYSVRHGMLESRGAVSVFSDADLSTPIEECERLLAVIGQGYDIVVGSRDIIGSKIEVPQPLHRRVMGYTFMILRDWIAVSGFRDTQCGFKAFRRAAVQEVFTRARLERFAFDVEVLAIGKLLGLRICEVPVVWRNDERTKVEPLRDPLRMLVDLFRIRWNLIRGRYGRPVWPASPGAGAPAP